MAEYFCHNIAAQTGAQPGATADAQIQPPVQPLLFLTGGPAAAASGMAGGADPALPDGAAASLCSSNKPV